MENVLLPTSYCMLRLRKIWTSVFLGVKVSGKVRRHFYFLGKCLVTNNHNCCDKSFSRAGCLRKHMFTHSGERPHKCLLCNKSFALSERLKAHLKIHKKKQQSEQFSSVFKKIKFWKTLVFLPTFVKRLNQKNSNIFTSLRASWQTGDFADVTLVWEDGHQVEVFK